VGSLSAVATSSASDQEPRDVTRVGKVTTIQHYVTPESNRGMIAISIDGGPETIVDQHGVTPDKLHLGHP
jgi:hypothetical protein